MLEIRRTENFDRWLEKLDDQRAKARIALRIDRLRLGNPGDVRPVGEGVSELRLDYGPGYRLYFIRLGEELIVLLCGGTKNGQDRDIKQAKKLATKLRESKS